MASGRDVGTGDPLSDACAREVIEETGPRVVVGDLLQVAEVLDRVPWLLQVTFRCVLLGDSTPLRPGPSGSSRSGS